MCIISLTVGYENNRPSKVKLQKKRTIQNVPFVISKSKAHIKRLKKNCNIPASVLAFSYDKYGVLKLINVKLILIKKKMHLQ